MMVNAHRRQRLHAAEALGDRMDIEQRWRHGQTHRLIPRTSRLRRAPPRATGRPAGTASSAPAPGRTAACGSPPARRSDLAEQRLLQRLDRIAQQLRHEGQQHGAEDHAPDIAHAAQHHHGQHHDGFDQDEAFRADETLDRGEHAAGDAAEGGAHGEGEQLDAAWC